MVVFVSYLWIYDDIDKVTSCMCVSCKRNLCFRYFTIQLPSSWVRKILLIKFWMHNEKTDFLHLLDQRNYLWRHSILCHKVIMHAYISERCDPYVYVGGSKLLRFKIAFFVGKDLSLWIICWNKFRIVFMEGFHCRLYARFHSLILSLSFYWTKLEQYSTKIHPLIHRSICAAKFYKNVFLT